MIFKFGSSDVRISKLGNDERVYGSRLIFHFLHNYWIFSWDFNYIFGAGREEAQAEETSDRRQV